MIAASPNLPPAFFCTAPVRQTPVHWRATLPPIYSFAMPGPGRLLPTRRLAAALLGVVGVRALVVS